jgi:hypothetical protein
MSRPPPPGDAPLPPPLARRVDEVCDHFEAAWQSARTAEARPVIEVYLARVAEAERSALLRELVLLEADYRRLGGETPRPEDFLARFPQLDPAWLAAALAARTIPGSRAAASATEAAPPPGPGDGAPPPVPASVGGYRLVRPLGGGGMGTVYEAEEVASGRRVALKFLAPELADAPEAIARFRAEGRLAGAIVHPRCVFVLAADEEAGRPYIVMELMPGDTLADLVKRQGPLPPGQAVACILDVLDGLLEAHRAGVIHRDVKPSNCFLTTDGRVKVGDFGLAKSLARSAHLTRTGTFLGTPLYASPEQIKGQAVDRRTDVYSVAATLYYLLAGKAPFEGGDALAVIAQVVSDAPPPLRGLRPDVPAGLERVVLRGLERDRDRRPQTLEELRAALLPFSPERASAGTPGWRLAAHQLDGFLFTLLGTDLGLFALLALWDSEEGEPGRKQALFLVWNALWIGMFTLLEGLWGWSPAKLLLGLRVWTVSGSEPPGISWALVRTVVHFVIVYLAGSVLVWISYGDPEAAWLGFLNLFTVILGGLLLLSTMRARNGYRGPHDFLSGTRVVRLPPPEAEDILPVGPERQPACIARPAEAPERLGPFTVQGALRWSPSQKILIGTDDALGRSVWIELRPADDAGLPPARRDLHRPTRLRWLGGGIHERWQWDAFPAPAGVPAADLVAAGRRLGWHQARPLLEQLADELAAASADGTLPPTLTLEQVWVRPGGQVLLLDAPPGSPPGEPSEVLPATEQERSLVLLRQTAVLLLDREEKSSWSPLGPVRRAGLWVLLLGALGCSLGLFLEGHTLVAGGLLLLALLVAYWLAMARRAKAAQDREGRIRSPLPGHADALLGRLLGSPRPYATIAEVRADLEATRDRPARVTPRLRLAHLATLGTLLSVPLVLVFVFAKSLNALAITALEEEITGVEKALYALDSGRLRDFIKGSTDPDGNLERLSDPALRRHLVQALQRQKEDLKVRLEAVNVVEWLWLGQEVKRAQKLLEPGRAVDLTPLEGKHLLRVVDDVERKTRHPQWFRAYAVSDDGPALVFFALTLVAVCPICWVVWAGLCRGGLVQRLFRLSLVMANGHRARRLQCAWRALVVWAPATALLGLTLWLDAYHPDQARWSWASWGGALLVLFGIAAVALRYPARGLHDRLAGTYLVPH